MLFSFLLSAFREAIKSTKTTMLLHQVTEVDVDGTQWTRSDRGQMRQGWQRSCTPMDADCRGAEASPADDAVFCEAMRARCHAEGWTARDILAAKCQSALLSYRSSEGAAAQHGPRYVKSSPDQYAHNCPWNDWTPPSESERRFREAAATRKVDAVSCRVRVHLCMNHESLGNRVIAFASVETNEKGKQALVLRRGADTLASMSIGVLRIRQISPENPRVLALTIRGDRNGHAICLCFENDKRVETFAAMLCSALCLK
jgi:hypothetical protein